VSRGVRILCRPEVAAGFAMTGLPVFVVHDDAEAAVCYRAWLDDPGLGVALVQQGLHDRFPDDIRTRQARQPLPMLVPFPDPLPDRAAPGAEGYIVELLRQVIGYRVRLQ
jgi:vacuolar-type H+-ATPase subunit F/Vma7